MTPVLRYCLLLVVLSPVQAQEPRDGGEERVPVVIREPGYYELCAFLHNSVVDREQTVVGRVGGMIVNLAGEMEFLVLSRDDPGASLVPWRSVHLVPGTEQFQIDAPASVVAEAPTFDPQGPVVLDAQAIAAVARHYRADTASAGVRKRFRSLDHNGDGVLDLAEFASLEGGNAAP